MQVPASHRGASGPHRSRPGRLALAVLLSLSASAAALAEDGPTIYAHRCAGCHQSSGAGLADHFPPLNSLGPWLAVPEGRKYMIEVLLYGPWGTVTVGGKNYDGAMPSQGQRMSDVEEVAVLRYVAEKLNTPPPGYQPFDPADVAALRKTPGVESGMAVERTRLPVR